MTTSPPPNPLPTRWVWDGVILIGQPGYRVCFYADVSTKTWVSDPEVYRRIYEPGAKDITTEQAAAMAAGWGMTLPD